MEAPLVLKIKEDFAIPGYVALSEEFGGVWEGEDIEFDTELFKGYFSIYQLHPMIEMAVHDARSTRPVIMDRIPDNKPNLIHVVFVQEGKYTFSREKYNPVTIGLGCQKGIFLHDGMFPMKSEFHANISYRWITIRFHIERLKELFPNMAEMHEKLFHSSQPTVYQFPLSAELNKAMDELYSYRELSSGRKALSVAKGIEILTRFFFLVRHEEHHAKLNGIHADDYNILLKVKNRLLRQFEERVTIQNLSEEFGMSQSKLKRDFKRIFGTTIYKMYMHARIEEAYRRLKTGKFTVSEVGYDLGYQNMSKFSEMFKKVTGISPKEVVPVT